MLFSRRRRRQPGPKGPNKELIDEVVELKRRNLNWGCPRIAQQIALASALRSTRMWFAVSSRLGASRARQGNRVVPVARCDASRNAHAELRVTGGSMAQVQCTKCGQMVKCVHSSTAFVRRTRLMHSALGRGFPLVILQQAAQSFSTRRAPLLVETARFPAGIDRIRCSKA
jgi:hypothetical protein